MTNSFLSLVEFLWLPHVQANIQKKKKHKIYLHKTWNMQASSLQEKHELRQYNLKYSLSYVVIVH